MSGLLKTTDKKPPSAGEEMPKKKSAADDEESAGSGIDKSADSKMAESDREKMNPEKMQSM